MFSGIFHTLTQIIFSIIRGSNAEFWDFLFNMELGDDLAKLLQGMISKQTKKHPSKIKSMNIVALYHKRPGYEIYSGSCEDLLLSIIFALNSNYEACDKTFEINAEQAEIYKILMEFPQTNKDFFS